MFEIVLKNVLKFYFKLHKKKNNSLDLQHAVIEYVDDENSFLLHDLNTVNGTYVNDCRIQNAAVRLSESDTIRFGFNGTPFQLVYQSQVASVNLNI